MLDDDLDTVRDVVDRLAALNVVACQGDGNDAVVRWTDPERASIWPSLFALLEREVVGVADWTGTLANPVKLAVCFGVAQRGDRPEIYSGRGFEASAALFGCLAEAAEGLSARWRSDVPSTRASQRELGGAAIDPNEILLLSERGIARGQRDAVVPFDATGAVRWVEAHSLVDGATRLVPAACVYLGYPGDDGGPAFDSADSNGCAAGSSEEDATLRALLELVERDALAIWWRNRLRKPPLDLGSLEAPEVDLTCAWAKSRGRQIALLDLSHDLGVSVVAATSWDDDGRDLLVGAGAAADLATAARAAVSEVFQVEANARAIRVRSAEAGREALSPDALALLTWLDGARLEDHPYLLPSDDPPTIGQKCSVSEEARLDAVIGGMTRAGVEPYAVDLTRDSIGVPVVRVIAPGLRHHRRGFGPGRLYDVPVTLGWRSSPLSEEDVNRETLPL